MRYSFFRESLWAVALAVVLSLGCARTPLKERNQSLRAASIPDIQDDLDLGSLQQGLKSQIRYLRRKAKEPKETLVFGEKKIAPDRYAEALSALLFFLKKNKENKEAVYQYIEKHFNFFEVYGADSWGEVLLTSYFEPEIPGSRKRTARFSEPLLAKPKDLVEISVSRFDHRFSHVKTMRGRLLRGLSRETTPKIAPYYSRREIAEGALKGRGLELVWVDPIDAFFLQIQGSGTIKLKGNRKLRLGYAEQNGHIYVAIGNFLKDKIPIDEMSLQKIEQHLRTLSDTDIRNYLNKNPSYIFFRKIKNRPTTSIGAPVVAGRTIATDDRYFPKGALGFIEFEKPKFESPSDIEPKQWESAARFVLDQDTGGAIRGGGRVDLFWGTGAQAKQSAGVMKRQAKLWYLLPKTVKW